MMLLNSSAQFIPSNMLKTNFTYKKFVEIFTVSFFIIASYSNENKEIGMSFMLFFALLDLGVCLKQFPYVSIQVASFYISVVIAFLGSIILLILREFSDTYSDENFMPSLLIMISINQALGQLIFKYKINQSVQKLMTGNPFQQMLLFQQLVYYQENIYKDTEVRIKFMGIIFNHQHDCLDKECPCYQNIFTEKKKQYTELEIKMKQDTYDKFTQKDADRILFTNIYADPEAFKIWTMEFVEYNLMQLLTNMFNSNYNSIDIQNFMIMFWFFEVDKKGNFIKPFYISKIWKFSALEKSFFFSLVESCLIKYIDNYIKTKDRSLKYSFRKRDIMIASQYEKFENFVICESNKREIKKKFEHLVQLKINYLEKLIAGYDTLQNVQKDIIQIMKETENLENIFVNELQINNDSMHILKLYTLFKMKILNDTPSVSSIEKKIGEINRKDFALDQNTVTSLSVIQGNVITIVASFGREQGKFLAYSEKTPEFFNYKQQDFSSVQGVKALMPTIVADYHDNFIKRLINEGTNHIIRKYRPTLGLDKQNFIFPVSVYINYFFDNLDEFSFSALLIKKQSQSIYVLINGTGKICGVSEGFLEFMKMVCPEVSQDTLYDSYIYLMMYDMIEFIKKFNSEELYELIQLQLKVPENIETYLQKYRLKFKQWEERKIEREKQQQEEEMLLLKLNLKEEQDENNNLTENKQLSQLEQESQFKASSQHQSDFQALRTIMNKTKKTVHPDDEKDLDELVPNPKNMPSYFNIGFNCTCNVAQEAFDSGQETLELYVIELLHISPIIEDFTMTQTMGTQSQHDGGQSMYKTDYDGSQTQSVWQQYQTQLEQDGKMIKEDQDEEEDETRLQSQNKLQDQSDIRAQQLIKNSNSQLLQSIPQIDSAIQSNKDNNNNENNNLILPSPSPEQSETSNKKSALKKKKFGQNISDSDQNKDIAYGLLNNQEGDSLLQSDKEEKAAQSIYSKISKMQGSVFSENQTKIKQKTKFQESSSDDDLDNKSNKTEDEQVGKKAKKAKTYVDIDEQGSSSNSISSGKNASDIINGRGKNDGKKNQNMEGGSSVGSTANMISNSLKRIFQAVDSKEIPSFLTILFSVFSGILFFFIILIIFAVLQFINNQNDFDRLIQEINFPSKIWIPISQMYMAGNFFNIRNQKQQNSSNQQFTNFGNIQKDIDFMEDIANHSYKELEIIIDKTIQSSLEYQYQTDYYDKTINVQLISEQIEQNQQMAIIEYLKKVRHNFFMLTKQDVQDNLNYNSEEMYLLSQNFLSLRTVNENMEKLFEEDIHSQEDSIKNININQFIIQIIAITLCFSLFYYPFSKYSINMQKTLNLITRITEKEGKKDIDDLKVVQNQITSPEEPYLKNNLTNQAKFDIIGDNKKKGKSIRSMKSMKSVRSAIKSIRSMRSMGQGGIDSEEEEKKKKKQKKQNEKKQLASSNIKAKQKNDKKKKGSQYLADRIRNNNINISAMLVVLILLLVSYIGEFIGLFVTVDIFLSDFEKPLLDFYSQIIAISQISQLSFLHNALLVNKIVELTQPDSQEYINPDQLSQFQSRYETLQQESQKFFSSTYLQISYQESFSGQFIKDMEIYNQGDACSLISEPELYLSICNNVQEGLLTRGLNSALQNWFNMIQNRFLDNYNENNIRTFINNDILVSELKVTELILNLMRDIQERFNQENKQILENYKTLYVNIGIFGSLSVVLFATIFGLIIANRLLQNYFFIKKAIHLVPYQRLSHDNTTKHLLKQTIGIN